jgi:putative drug exporter of the RND superfamily
VIVKVLGIGLGVAIMIDVLIVRMLVAPAVMTLLGDRAWWLPGWLDRLLPRLELERPEKTGGTPEAGGGRAPVPAGRPTPAEAGEG